MYYIHADQDDGEEGETAKKKYGRVRVMTPCIIGMALNITFKGYVRQSFGQQSLCCRDKWFEC